jgi:hypothetical protein
MAQGIPFTAAAAMSAGLQTMGSTRATKMLMTRGREHHAHLLVGGGAPDLLHGDALEAPAKCGNEPNEDGTHGASLMECD